MARPGNTHSLKAPHFIADINKMAQGNYAAASMHRSLLAQIRYEKASANESWLFFFFFSSFFK